MDNIEKGNSRSKRSVSNLTSAISSYLSGDASSVPGSNGLDVNDFLRHLNYQCGSCVGPRDLLSNCHGERSDICTGKCQGEGLKRTDYLFNVDSVGVKSG